MINRLQLHCLDLRQSSPDDAELLSPDERQRANRFAFPHLHRRFLAAHSAMRRRLGQILEVAPEKLKFHIGPQGKPFLPAFPRLSFNLAHSEELAVLALWLDDQATKVQLGVDVEVQRASTEFYGISRRYFAPGEQESLPSPLNPEFFPAFLRLWTRKEAVTKCLGTGLRTPLTSFDTSSTPPHFPGETQTSRPSSPNWLSAGYEVKWLKGQGVNAPLVVYQIDFAAWGATEYANKYVAALCLSGTMPSEESDGELVGLA